MQVPSFAHTQEKNTQRLKYQVARIIEKYLTVSPPQQIFLSTYHILMKHILEALKVAKNIFQGGKLNN